MKGKCEKEREEAAGKNYRATKAGTKQAPEFVPLCNPDGSYVKIQVDKTNGYGYCVDEETGKEIDGTRRVFSKGPPLCLCKNHLYA